MMVMENGDRRTGDIRHAYSVVGFYKSTFGLEFDAGYSAAVGEPNLYPDSVVGNKNQKIVS
ncbi:hypothetical protein IC611_06220 [Proteus mirabilis]